jgi:mersacidin/lichenicidin family type 2 lantibiotic
MSQPNIIRAWKDATYRNSLSPEERAALPDNPAGVIELADADLAEVNGGFPWLITVTVTTVMSHD